MADRSLTQTRGVYFLAYFGLMAVFLLVALLPISLDTDRWPWPDLMVAATFAWVLRRPQFVSTPLVAIVFLIADMLLMRPMGLWAAFMVLAAEFLRFREAAMREQLFPIEWLTISALLFAMTIANFLILNLTLAQQPPFGLVFLQFIMTVLSYPFIVLISRFGFNVLKMKPNETDAKGRPR